MPLLGLPWRRRRTQQTAAGWLSWNSNGLASNGGKCGLATPWNRCPFCAMQRDAALPVGRGVGASASQSPESTHELARTLKPWLPCRRRDATGDGRGRLADQRAGQGTMAAPQAAPTVRADETPSRNLSRTEARCHQEHRGIPQHRGGRAFSRAQPVRRRSLGGAVWRNCMP